MGSDYWFASPERVKALAGDLMGVSKHSSQVDGHPSSRRGRPQPTHVHLLYWAVHMEYAIPGKETRKKVVV